MRAVRIETSPFQPGFTHLQKAQCLKSLIMNCWIRLDV